MRVLTIGLFTLILSGFSMQSISIAKPLPNLSSQMQSDPTVIPIYTNAQDVVGKPFRDLGEVSGESCQESKRDKAPNISVARKNMQVSALAKNADAIMLYSCESLQNESGCYRQVMCTGSALEFR
ncbi:Rcs stress response system protein RcsF [Budvicia aquatica]|uniref:Outer membrane lipoprotein n=1 Tax=Budvicia aquatica TaxID=82979 RepID=A0A2C6DPM2_9GAMM|nr:Rcs stress response system protein RcsF [Budvicia aquatica]PHI30643.1 Rcs stress response system protein RcsF [Budvicia aquatica]VFS50143.1 outer membrane lipoprotein [Budvicia aquatica]